MLVRWVPLALVAALSLVTLVRDGAAPRSAEAAPQIGPLVASATINDRAEPVNPQIEFDSSNNGFWVSVPYRDLPAGSSVTRVVRFNGSDFNWDGDMYGRLNCCPSGGTGRFAFQVLRLNGEQGELPGGAYEIRVYLNGQEAAFLGVGVKGASGNDRGDVRDVPGGDEGDNDND